MDPGFVELIFKWGRQTITVTQVNVKMLIVTGGTDRHGTVRGCEGAFELFGDVHKGSLEDRTGNVIWMAQC